MDSIDHLNTRVLSWTIQDYFTSAQECQEIPLVFSSARDYYDILLYYFYIELKSEILHTIDSSKSVKVFVNISKLSQLEGSKLVIHEAPELRKNDLVVLSTSEFLLDHTKVLENYLFCVVLEVSHDRQVHVETVLDENMEEFKKLKNGNGNGNWELKRVLNLDVFSKKEVALLEKSEFPLLFEIMNPQISKELIIATSELEEIKGKLEEISNVTKMNFSQTQINAIARGVSTIICKF
jgi:hypothetical protein